MFVARQSLRLAARNAVRAFATEAAPAASSQKAELDEAIAKHLKPEVVKTLYAKTDQLLIRKLNFFGPAIAVRLNTASKIILQSLSQENCLRILTEELQDPWDYYWTIVKENGNDPQKWLESLQEVKHLPWVASKCWVQMQMHGVFPMVEHYNVFFHTLSLIGNSGFLHDHFDALKRRNFIKSKPTDETWNTILSMWINKANYPVAKHFETIVKKRGFNVSPQNSQKLAEMEAKWDHDAANNYFSGASTEKPAFLAEAMRQDEALEEYALNLVEEYYQPPIDKLVVRE